MEKFFTDISFMQEVYLFLAITLPYWFPFVMLAIGKSLIFKIKNPDIRLTIFAVYTAFCVLFFVFGIKELYYL